MLVLTSFLLVFGRNYAMIQTIVHGGAVHARLSQGGDRAAWQTFILRLMPTALHGCA
jgi:hypothetical protein